MTGPNSLAQHFSREVIRIHPKRIISFGVNADNDGMAGRNVG